MIEGPLWECPSCRSNNPRAERACVVCGRDRLKPAKKNLPRRKCPRCGTTYQGEKPGYCTLCANTVRMEYTRKRNEQSHR